MASTSHTINHTGEADTASSHTGWGPDRSLCAWIPTQYPPAASFAGRSSPSLHSPYSATMPLSPQLGPGILMTPPSTQQDQSSISWTGSPHSSQASPSNNNGTGDFHWMNLMSGPEFDSPTCARTIIQPHTTDTTPCQHHVHTPERTSENRTSVNAELKHYGRFKCHWKGCTYPGTFSRDQCLLRHIKSTHVTPDEFKCPDSQCNKTFGRKDRFQNHMRLAHTSHGKGECCSSCRA